MAINHKQINKAGRIVIDSLLVMLLWTILALPASSFSLLKILPQEDKNVLSEKDTRSTKVVESEDETKSFREVPQSTSTLSENGYVEVEESTPSEMIAP